MVTSGEAELDAEVAEIRATMMNEGEEKSLFIVAEKGALEIVDQMLKDSNWESVSRKNRLRLCCSPWGNRGINCAVVDADDPACHSYATR
ncbi:hypothetical protein GW17_00021651 [Ensete ventricosum]|nr:hypothetical protein GW17_00021651 [Ensete ventricosum]